MFTIDDVEKNYELGNQTGRRYDTQNPKNPDSFEFVRGENQGAYLTFEESRLSQESLEFYYQVAFANYWKRGVEKEIKQKGLATSPLKIQVEMIKSLDALNYLCGAILMSEGKGINIKGMLNNPQIVAMPYAKMFIESFTANPSRFATLFNAITDNIQYKSVLNESHNKNGVITFDLKPREQTIKKDQQLNK